jgi:hypothetical protein
MAGIAGGESLNQEPTMKRFANRTVAITGGVRGMGPSHARGFVAEGANVVIADVPEQEGRALAEDLGDQAAFVRLDVGWAAAMPPPRTPSVRSPCWSTTRA